MRRELRRRVANAWRSFHAGEADYRLAIGRFGGFDVAYRAGTADEKVIAHSFDDDIFLPGVPEYAPRRDDVVLDVGAHIGTFALAAARRAPEGIVHAVEASGETFNYLRVNAALNGLANLVPHHLALTDRPGTVRLHHNSGNWGHSIMKPLSPRGEDVPADSLEGFWSRCGLDRVAFAKFNCEGAKFPILMAAPVDLLRRISTMLVLYHLDFAVGHRLEPLLARLEEAGFVLRVDRRSATRGWIVARRDP